MRSGRPLARHRTAPDGVRMPAAAPAFPVPAPPGFAPSDPAGRPGTAPGAVWDAVPDAPRGARRDDPRPAAAPPRPELGSRGFTVLAGVVAVAAVALCVLSSSGLLSERESTVVDNAGQFLGGCAAAVAGFWSWRRARRPDRAWRLLLALGIAGWTGGLCVWAWFQIVVGEELPSPSPADVGFFMLPLFALPALYLFPAHERAELPERPEARPYVRLVHVLDSLIVVGSLFVLTWSTALGAALHGTPPSRTPQFLVALGYPVTDLMLVVFVVLIGSLRSPRNPLALVLLGLGLVGISASDSFYLWLVSRGAEEMPPLYNVGFVLGPALLALALVAPDPWAHERRRRADGHGDRGAVFLPYLPLLVTGTVLVAQLAGAGAGGIDRVEGALGLALVGLVICRQLVTLVDNVNLLHQVRDGQRRLQRQAYYDSLTGLANRPLFRDRLDRAVEAHATERRPLALLFCDLDDFKFVNDRHGHAAGDELLRVTAERLRRSVRPGDTVARLGGDEFAVLLAGTDSPETVAKRVLAELEQPAALPGAHGLRGGAPVTVQAGASVGLVVIGPGDPPIAPDALLASVDSAMYAAKRRGKHRLVVFHGDQLGGDEHGMLGELRMAIVASGPNGVRAGSSGRIEVMYQPIVAFRTGQVVAVEALVRWQHPRHGTLPAEVLVAAADDAGMLPALEELVLEVACRDIRLLRSEAALRRLAVHVNVSASRAGDPGLPGVVREALERHRLPGDALVVEITETSRVPDLAAAAGVLGEISELGVRLALDDFGTGYSGLSYLLELPIDIVKLDRSLTVAEAATRGGTIRHAAAALTLGLGLDLVAEGVETPAQAQLLAGLGCELGQGFLWARPRFLAELDLTAGQVPGPDVDRTVSPIHAGRRVTG